MSKPRIIKEPVGIRRLLLSPDDTTLCVIGTDDVMRLWSLTGAKPALVAESPDHAFAEIAFDKTGGLLAISNDKGFVSVWDARAGRELAGEHLGGFVDHLAFAQDGSYVATSHRGEDGVIVWDWQNHAIAGRALHDAEARGVEIVDGRLYTVSEDAKAIVWDLPSGDPSSSRRFPGAPKLLRTSPDGTVVTVATKTQFVVWNLLGADLFNVTARADGVDFDSKSRTMVVSSGSRVVVFELEPFLRRFHYDLPDTFLDRRDNGGDFDIERRLRPAGPDLSESLFNGSSLTEIVGASPPPVRRGRLSVR
jgi:WD40 repeat protein